MAVNGALGSHRSRPAQMGESRRLQAETERRQATLAAFQQVAQALLDGAGRDDILGEIAARAKALARASSKAAPSSQVS